MAEMIAEAVRAFARRVADLRGWRVNPDAQHADAVLAALEENRQRYGYYLCPCRDGSGDRRQDAEITCPCRSAEADVAEHGHCLCALFVSPSAAGQQHPEQPLEEGFGRDLCSIKDVVREINELEKQLKGAHGLTLNEGLCLCCVSKLSRSPGDCARQIGLSASRLSRVLNSLEKKGLLERRSRAADHRSSELVITDKGYQRLQELRDSGFTFSRLDERARALSLKKN